MPGAGLGLALHVTGDCCLRNRSDLSSSCACFLEGNAGIQPPDINEVASCKAGLPLPPETFSKVVIRLMREMRVYA